MPSAKTLSCALPFRNPLKDKMDKMTGLARTELKEYDYAEHKFRFAAWAAAASKPVNRRRGISIDGDDWQCILRVTGFPYEIADKGAERLPGPGDFDMQHRAWCEKVHNEAKERFGIVLSYGQSAKLINVFLKALMPADLEDAGFPPGEKKNGMPFILRLIALFCKA